jgi:hypothetical protein
LAPNIPSNPQWTLSLGYLLFVVLTSLADPSFGGPQAAIYLTTDSNARFINGLIYGSLTLLAITCAGDWLILRVNARKSRERRLIGFLEIQQLFLCNC